MEVPSFGKCLAKMSEALAAFEAAAAEVERIEAEELAHLQARRDAHPNLVGGRQTPVTYDLPVALKLDHVYQQASARKGSTQGRAIMWGIAALAVATAGGQPDAPIQPADSGR